MDITVSDKEHNIAGVLDNISSIIWTDRYNRFGEFELYTDITAPLLNLLQPDYYLQNKYSDKTMIVESRQIITDAEFGDKLLVRGRSLESILDRRVIWLQTRITGSLHDGLKALVTNAFITPEGSLGDTQRKVSNMVWVDNTDPAVTGLTLEAQYVGELVYDVFESVCNGNNLGFKILKTDDNLFLVSIYVGTNRSYSQTTNPFVVFSHAFDNLKSSNYFASNEFIKSWGLVLGYVYDDGQLHRVIANGPLNWPSNPGLYHREIYIDARNYVSFFDQTTGLPLPTAEFNGQLGTYGSDFLKKHNNYIKEFDGEITIGSYKYGSDFFLGDIVQFEDKFGNKGSSRITEVIISEDPSGFRILPTFEQI